MQAGSAARTSRMVTALTAGLLWTQGTIVEAAFGLKGNECAS